MIVPPEENYAELKDPSVPFNVRYRIATEDQVDCARLLLKYVLFGLVSSFYDHLPGIWSHGTAEQQEVFKELQKSFTSEPNLFVPTKAKNDPETPLRVRLVRFGDYTASDGRHPAPNPLFWPFVRPIRGRGDMDRSSCRHLKPKKRRTSSAFRQSSSTSTFVLRKAS